MLAFLHIRTAFAVCKKDEGERSSLKTLIIIPAYNEEETILHTIGMLRQFPEYDYVVINDGSTDNTEQILRDNHINHITLVKNLGIGGAVQTGYKYAYQNGYDLTCQIDADGQHNPEYLDKMKQALLAEEADMVIGSRYIEKTGFQSTFSRRFGKNILTGIIGLIARKKITDPTSGFRMCGKNAIALFANYYPSDYPEPETIATFLARRMTVVEVPVVMNEREGGTSSITPLKSMYYMIKVSIAIVFSYLGNRKKRRHK